MIEYKKTLTTFILLSSLTGALSAATPSDEEHWAYPATKKLEERGFFEGMPKDEQAGNGPATRFDVATMVSKCLDILASAREIGEIQQRTLNLRDQARGLSGRLQRLIDDQGALQKAVKDLHERRRR